MGGKRKDYWILAAVALVVLVGYALFVWEQTTEDVFLPVHTQTGNGIIVEEDSVLIDLNEAGADLLRRLPGIGPKLAGRIVEYRDAHGLFASVDEIVSVSGIGEKTLEKIRPFVGLTFPDAEPLPSPAVERDE